jgi:hypothetical protein
MAIITVPANLRYYDLRRHWTRRIMPHLPDKELIAILVRDFNRYTHGRWRQRFRPGDLPCHFESCDWHLHHGSRAIGPALITRSTQETDPVGPGTSNRSTSA